MTKVNYKKFTKHAEKVTKGVPIERPVLKGINHDDKGTLVVTDAHRAYRARNVNAPRNVILDAVTGDEIDGNFPDMERIFPDSEAPTLLSVDNASVFAKVLKAMTAAACVDGGKKGNAKVELTSEMVALWEGHTNTVSGIEFSYELNLEREGDKVSVVLSLQYLLDVVEMLDDMGASKIEIGIHAHNRPVTIRPTDSDNIEAIILPIRKGAY